MKYNPFRFILLILIVSVCACNRDHSGNLPNVVLILADDLGYGDLGCYGCRDIKTPNIDRLAKEGVMFTQFYANGPECTPTRAALLSGLYQQRIGGLECAIGAGNVGRYDEAMRLSEQNELGLRPEFSVLPNRLKEKGYHTAVIGKWHLGYEEKFRPDNQGFDYSIGPLGYGGDYFYHVEQDSIKLPDFTGTHNLARNGEEIFRDGKYMTELITAEAIKWLNQQSREEPFFLYLPFTAPHSPYQGPGDDPGRPFEGDEWNIKSRKKYIEMTEAMDHEIGRILSTLSEINMDKKTIVIFFSDNGGTRQADNGMLSGFKGHLWEGGIRVPCIIRWPGMIEEDTQSGQVGIGFDLTRSILKISGYPRDSVPVDGYDIIGHIIQQRENFDRTLFWRAKRGNSVKKAVRDGDDKYMIEIINDSIRLEKLFNLKEDVSETRNLLDALPGKADKLKILLMEWEQEVNINLRLDVQGKEHKKFIYKQDTRQLH
ncbi:MAG: sulfatase-like hydrolase/transferase [Bacteroidales bacterium]